MMDERFDELMRDAARTYNAPDEPPLDAMWAAVALRTERETPRRFRPWARRWQLPALVAAALIVGVAIGRASMMRTAAPATQPAATSRVASSAPRPAARGADDAGYDIATSRYLGQTAALLIALPAEGKAGGVDTEFVRRAGDLLTTTRLLLDSPAARDPSMHDLLEDLELVLAQVVRLPNAHDRTELELIRQALEQHDVLPRLRTAVADNSAN